MKDRDKGERKFESIILKMENKIVSRYNDCMAKFNAMSDDLKKRINEGIEKNRKGLIKIVVKDQKGNAVSDVKLKATQKSHEFLHGANLFMLDELEIEEKNRIYKEQFPKAFNQATLPFYWNALEPEEGKPRYTVDSPKIYRRPVPDLCLEYCAEKGITPKEHCLTYFAWHPDWVDKDSIEDTKKKLEKRYRELSERYADKIHCWEVINELLLAYQPENYGNAFFKDDEVLEWNFALAEKYFPNNELVVNEAPFVWHREHYDYNRSPYYTMIERARMKGARIDAIGMQFHVFSKAWEKYMYDPALLLEVLDLYARFGLPIQITEITIPAYSNDPEDERLQADLIEQLYTLWFSHKSVEMITYWNFVDGYAAHAKQGDMTKGENVFYGGLMRFDLTPKPAFERLCYLFNKKWHTEEAVTTDKNGEAVCKGFFGKYDIEIDGKHFEIAHTSKKQDSFEIIIEQ